jgi:hypothetical protein
MPSVIRMTTTVEAILDGRAEPPPPRPVPFCERWCPTQAGPIGQGCECGGFEREWRRKFGAHA